MKYLILGLFPFCINSVIAQSIQLLPENMDMIHISVSPSDYKGKAGVKVIGTNYNLEEMAILKNVVFSNGTIELDVSGKPVSETDTSFKGFIGIAFRVQQTDSLRYECFFLRPTLGRSEDQQRRNHSVQYVSIPGYTWSRLRKETPGKYESYADLEPGEWTHLKIIVKDQKASLFVNNAAQPCLIVNDLKHGITTGKLALWIGPGTEGYFSNMKIEVQ